MTDDNGRAAVRREGVGGAFNTGLIDAWRVIEYLAERQFDLANVAEISRELELDYSKTRRILFTWEHLGLIERRGDMWRLTELLTCRIPHKLKCAMSEKLKNLEEKND